MIKQKGFTLIELLAVILILGIIALIAIPTINKVLEESKKEALKVTIQNLDKAISSNCELNKLNEKEHIKTYTIKNGSLSPAFNISGSLPENGRIEVDSQCKTTIYTHNDIFCGIKKDNNINIDKTAVVECLPPEVPDESYFTCVNGVITNYSNDGPKILRIPDSIGGEIVTSIGYNAFSSKKIEKIILSDTISTIGERAFFGNELTSIVIPSSVTIIDKVAFSNNKLESVTIPNSVTSIGEHSFEFNNITSLVIPDSVTTLKRDAFANNQLTSLIISSSLTSISISAFENNNLSNIEIPTNITTIKDSAFYNNPLSNINMPGRSSNNLGTSWYEGTPTFNFD